MEAKLRIAMDNCTAIDTDEAAGAAGWGAGMAPVSGADDDEDLFAQLQGEEVAQAPLSMSEPDSSNESELDLAEDSDSS